MKRTLLAALLAAPLVLGLPAAGAEVDDAALMSPTPAETLSEYGFFRDPARQVPNRRVIPYSVANPLWTDGAEKLRFVYLPPGAPPAAYREEGVLDFPIGAALVKTFAYPAVDGEGRRLVETRVLIRQEAGWVAWPYVWNRDGTEARLKLAGARLEIDAPAPDGGMRTIRYAVPNRNQCKGCHVGADRTFQPIGPKVRNLNLVEPDGTAQLVRLAAAGIVSEAPLEAPAVPAPLDPGSGTLEARARAYLDGNCAHCHAPGAPADSSGLFLHWEEDRAVHLGIGKPPVAAGRGSGGLKVSIAPGEPDASIMVHRMESLDPGVMMPELGRSLPDDEGIALIRAWIESLDPS